MTVQNRAMPHRLPFNPFARLQVGSWNFKRFGANYLLFLLLTDTLLVQLAFWSSLRLRYLLPFGATLQPELLQGQLFIPQPALHLAVGVLWLLTFLLTSVYASSYIIQWADELQRVPLAHTIAALCLAGLLYMARIELMRLAYLYFYLSVMVALIGYRILLRLWHRTQHHELSMNHVLIVGAGDGLHNLINQFNNQEWPNYRLIGFVDDGHSQQEYRAIDAPLLGAIDQVNITELVRRYQIDDVVLALPRQFQGQTVNLVEQLRNLPIHLRVMPDYFDLTFRRATIGRLGDIPVIDLHDAPMDTFQRVAKRLIDLVGASIALVLAAPIMFSVALAIKLHDGGPILYLAKRVGENGNLFTMYKFRSMVVNADTLQTAVNLQDSTGTVVHKRKNDPRVTGLGRFIRRTSLDELPQLFNVLKGDMSLVGPRPELPWLVEQYEAWQYRRLRMPQGMTGWWQVNGRSNKLMHLNTEQDLYYIENYSIWLDLQILWRTFSVVLRGRGAY